jgi:hypothetical protein
LATVQIDVSKANDLMKSLTDLELTMQGLLNGSVECGEKIAWDDLDKPVVSSHSSIPDEDSKNPKDIILSSKDVILSYDYLDVPTFLRYQRRKKNRKTRKSPESLDSTVSDNRADYQLDNVIFLDKHPRFKEDFKTFKDIKEEVHKQLEQKCIDKDRLIELNEQLGQLNNRYGHIATLAVGIAAVISGINDLMALIEMINK